MALYTENWMISKLFLLKFPLIQPSGRAYCADLSSLRSGSILVWIPSILLILRVRHVWRSIDTGSIFAFDVVS